MNRKKWLRMQRLQPIWNRIPMNNCKFGKLYIEYKHAHLYFNLFYILFVITQEFNFITVHVVDICFILSIKFGDKHVSVIPTLSQTKFRILIFLLVANPFQIRRYLATNLLSRELKQGYKWIHMQYTLQKMTSLFPLWWS